MKLKKINEKLREGLVDNGLTEANKLQKKLFSLKKWCGLYYYLHQRKWKITHCYQCDPTISL
jgi:hypothetical protein